jgi:hypothetical protein
MNKLRLNLGISFAITLLTFATFRIFVSATSLEPFFSYSKVDAIYYVGLSSALLIVWLQIAIGIFVGVRLRRISVWWFIGIFWSIIGIACACSAANTWTNDMQNNVFGSSELQ